MRHTRITSMALLLALTLVAGAGLLSACGSSDESGAPGAGGTSGDEATGATAYRNDDYGFALEYPAGWKQSEATSASEAGSDAAFSVAFADPDSTVVDDVATDGVQVAVYELTREVAPEEVPQLKAEFQGIVDQMMGGLEDGKIKDPLDDVELNDVPGFGFSYTYAYQGTPVRASVFFLVKGASEYQITAQASMDRWNEVAPELEATAMSFRAD